MKQLEYVQQIDHLKISITDLENILNERPIKDWCWTIHDKDILDNGEPKPAHLHLAMKFHSDQTIDNICKWFNDEPQFFEKGKTKSHTFEYMCAYQSHNWDVFPRFKNVKYMYPTELIHCTFDYDEMIERLLNGFKKHLESNTKHISDDILRKIYNNEIPRIKLTDYVDPVIVVRNRTLIDNAYKLRDEKLAKEITRTMDVMYLNGQSGSGKTTVAKWFASNLGYTTFVSGSSNDPLQGYMGQECIILDDIRGSDWKINDLLKFLDNNTSSLVKSRYSNKLLNDCKLVILTSVKTLDELYASLGEHETEPIEQLKRRCKTYIEVKEDYLNCCEYDEIIGNYVNVKKLPNPTPLIIAYKKNRSLISDMMGMLDKVTQDNDK